jgi:transcriptional regulator with XRE-family HTH domain
VRHGYDHNDIEKWLIPLLQERGLRIEPFAYLCGVSKTAMYGYLSDKNRPRPETMAKMCQVLGVPEEEGLAQYSPREREPRQQSVRKPRSSRKRT